MRYEHVLNSYNSFNFIISLLKSASRSKRKYTHITSMLETLVKLGLKCLNISWYMYHAQYVYSVEEEIENCSIVEVKGIHY